MNLRPEQYLTALALAQAGEVAPALEGSYAGGTAGTIAGVLMFAVQDIAGREARERAEHARLAGILGDAGRPVETLDAMRQAVIELHAEIDARSDDAAKALARRILDHYVRTAEAALLVVPPPV
jgi:hypothetical protein